MSEWGGGSDLPFRSRSTRRIRFRLQLNPSLRSHPFVVARAWVKQPFFQKIKSYNAFAFLLANLSLIPSSVCPLPILQPTIRHTTVRSRSDLLIRTVLPFSLPPSLLVFQLSLFIALLLLSRRCRKVFSSIVGRSTSRTPLSASALAVAVRSRGIEENRILPARTRSLFVVFVVVRDIDQRDVTTFVGLISSIERRPGCESRGRGQVFAERLSCHCGDLRVRSVWLSHRRSCGCCWSWSGVVPVCVKVENCSRKDARLEIRSLGESREIPIRRTDEHDQESH